MLAQVPPPERVSAETLVGCLNRVWHVLARALSPKIVQSDGHLLPCCSGP